MGGALGEGDSAGKLCLICRAGQLCALPLDKVVEVMRPLPVEGLPGLPPFVLGAAIVRGAPVPVVGLERLLGGAPAAPEGRFVSMRLGSRRAALAVAEVLGIRSVPHGELGRMEPLLGGAGGPVAELSIQDGELLLALEAARLVPQQAWDAWEALGRGRA